MQKRLCNLLRHTNYNAAQATDFYLQLAVIDICLLSDGKNSCGRGRRHARITAMMETTVEREYDASYTRTRQLTTERIFVL